MNTNLCMLSSSQNRLSRLDLSHPRIDSVYFPTLDHQQTLPLFDIRLEVLQLWNSYLVRTDLLECGYSANSPIINLYIHPRAMSPTSETDM